MQSKRERAQSILEYVILFGILTALVGVTLVTIFSGSGQFQNVIKIILDSAS